MLTSRHGPAFCITGLGVGNPSTDCFPTQMAVLQDFFYVFFAVDLNKCLNEQSSYQWFETQTPAWRHCSVCAYDINVMWFHVTSPKCFDFSITTGLRSVSCTVLTVSANLGPTPYSLPSKRRISMWPSLGRYVSYVIIWRSSCTIAFDIPSNTKRYLTRY